MQAPPAGSGRRQPPTPQGLSFESVIRDFIKSNIKFYTENIPGQASKGKGGRKKGNSH
jgi:hypothetical protein